MAPMLTSPVSSSRRDAFTLPADLHYLNCGYMSPLPRVVEAAGVAGIARKRVPSLIGPRDFFDESDRLRTTFARLINAGDPGRIAIVPAASYGIAVAARNLRIEAGQTIVLAAEQFPSNVYAWRRLAARSGAEVRMIAPPGDGSRRAAGWNARLVDAIDDRTAIVALGAVHWTDGTRFDLDAIGERARANGAAFIIDGSQAVGAVPIDVTACQPDALITVGYKWLFGPLGIAFAWFGPRFDDGEPLEETWLGRRGSEDFRRLVEYEDAYQAGAARYDVGERANFVLVPMMQAALDLVTGWTVPAVAEYCRALTEPFAAEAEALGLELEEPQWRSPHLLGLRFGPDVDRARLTGELERRSVSVSLRGSAVRVSVNVYNEREDLEALVDALRATLTA